MATRDPRARRSASKADQGASRWRLSSWDETDGEAGPGAPAVGSCITQVSGAPARHLGGCQDPHLGGFAAHLPAAPKWALCLVRLALRTTPVTGMGPAQGHTEGRSQRGLEPSSPWMLAEDPRWWRGARGLVRLSSAHLPGSCSLGFHISVLGSRRADFEEQRPQRKTIYVPPQRWPLLTCPSPRRAVERRPHLTRPHLTRDRWMGMRGQGREGKTALPDLPPHRQQRGLEPHFGPLAAGDTAPPPAPPHWRRREASPEPRCPT